MLGNIWHSSNSAAEYLGITEIKLSYLRENGFLKPGIHWRSSPHGQKKPWNPEALYNSLLCKKIIDKYYSEDKYDQYAAWFLKNLKLLHIQKLFQISSQPNSRPYSQSKWFEESDIN